MTPGILKETKGLIGFMRVNLMQKDVLQFTRRKVTFLAQYRKTELMLPPDHLREISLGSMN